MQVMATNDILAHHGIKGQKWGVRRYQNPDGTLTAAGKRQFKKVSKDKKAQKFSERNAVSILKKENRSNARAISKLDKKLNKENDETRRTQYSDEIKERDRAISKNQKRISDIKSGTVKAGQDYIVKSNTMLVPYVIITTGPKIRFGKAQVNKRLIYKD